MRPRTAPHARPSRLKGARGHRFLTSAVAAGVVASLVLSGGSGAGAQSVESLRDKAARLAAEVEQLEVRASELDEQYLQLQGELSELEQQQAANRKAVEEAE
jgi:TolA-binding protein